MKPELNITEKKDISIGFTTQNILTFLHLCKPTCKNAGKANFVCVAGAYQGAKYFSYNGKVLDEIRKGKECS